MAARAPHHATQARRARSDGRLDAAGRQREAAAVRRHRGGCRRGRRGQRGLAGGRRRAPAVRARAGPLRRLCVRPGAPSRSAEVHSLTAEPERTQLLPCACSHCLKICQAMPSVAVQRVMPHVCEAADWAQHCAPRPWPRMFGAAPCMPDVSAAWQACTCCQLVATLAHGTATQGLSAAPAAHFLLLSAGRAGHRDDSVLRTPLDQSAG